MITGVQMQSREEVIAPPQPRTVYDVKCILNSFIPKNKTQGTISANIDTVDSSGRSITVNVSAPLGADYYSQLVEGMQMVKHRLDAIDKYGDNARKTMMLDGNIWVDIIIRNHLGGVRDGCRIKWEVEDGVVYFDPLTGKMTQCERSST